MTARADNGGSYVGERFGRMWRSGARRGSSRSDDALRMTAKTGSGNLCVGNLRGVDGVLLGEVIYGIGTEFGQDGGAAVGRGG